MSDDDIREMLIASGQWMDGWISQRIIDSVRKQLHAPKK
jgi:hypothetical protein